MKNKEIEEVLNDIKTHDYKVLNREDYSLLLSYIQQLEEDNEYLKRLCETQNNREYRSKFLKEFQKEHGKNVFPDYDEIYKRYDSLKEKNKQLENNRDKAIEQCNDWIKFYKKLNSDERLILRLEEISRTLKGDSDE